MDTSDQKTQGLAARLANEVKEMILEIKTSRLVNLRVSPNHHQSDLDTASIFNAVRRERKTLILELTKEVISAGDVKLSRSVASLVGMAVADGLGHNFEFMDVRDFPEQSNPPRSYFEYPSSTPGGVFHPPVFNKFQLAPGQWTDDCSMGLCLADSLLTQGKYNGTNLRVWFFNWWVNGLNNAFRFDHDRESKHSVGLGGNISESFREVASAASRNVLIPPRFESRQEDAGNGSIMRLAPVPVRFHTDIKLARDIAYESSLSTHPGLMAAEACKLMAHIIVRAINRGADEKVTAAVFLDDVCEEYLTMLGPSPSGACLVIRRLLLSGEADSSTERCWNWKNSDLGLQRTLRNRGRRYNGYPVSAGYFGAFSIDGLSMALHCLYHTTSFNDAVVKIVNMRGDSDTTGSICAQMAGAFYGLDAIDAVWRQNVAKWDEHEIELRAVALHFEAEFSTAASQDMSSDMFVANSNSTQTNRTL